ncbi:hypothetical protein M885DRAFT_80793 [Pelagophyceae sp. CCMP2097]|nr:hypothetical protein M885DRAFT_80793 [Pelagophyceae sp. CCMP2097]
MLVRALLLCAAAVDGLAAKKGSAVKGGTSKPAGGGFGAPSDKKPVALTAAQLLNRADKRYDELEAKYALHDTLVFRDYVVTVRVPADDTTALASQLRDWVPVACLGEAASWKRKSEKSCERRQAAAVILSSARTLWQGPRRGTLPRHSCHGDLATGILSETLSQSSCHKDLVTVSCHGTLPQGPCHRGLVL